MMVNFVKLRRIAILMVYGAMPLLLFFVLLFTGFGALIATAVAALFIVVGVFIVRRMYNTPFDAIVEGEGLLTLTFDSTGVIAPFVARYVRGQIQYNIDGEEITEPFDRRKLLHLFPPRQAIWREEGEKIVIEIPKDELPDARFAFMGLPTIIYNRKLATTVAKNDLAKLETKDTLLLETINLRHEVRRLSDLVTHFARYVMDQLKPKKQWFQNTWLWIIIAIVIAAFVGYFLLEMLPTLFGGGTTAAAGAHKAAAGGIITPRG